MNATPVREWATQFTDDGSTAMEELGENFIYLLDHVDAYEAGDISFTDLPHFEPHIQMVLWESVRFGSMFYKETVDALYVVESKETGDFVAIYGNENNASERASEDGVTVRPVPINDVDDMIDEYIGNAPALPMADTLIDAFEIWRARYNELEKSEMVNLDEIPFDSEHIRAMFAYSVLFGMLWERCHPSLYGLFTSDNILDSVHPTDSRADDSASEMQYIQRLAITDGLHETDTILN